MQTHYQAGVGAGTADSSDSVSGDTPLMKACRAGDLHQTEVLIKAGAQIMAVNQVRFCMRLVGHILFEPIESSL